MSVGVVTLAVAQPHDAPELRELMARVIAESITQDGSLLRDTIDNVNRNLDVWLARPDECIHIKASVQARTVGVVLVKEFWNLCSLFVDAEFQGKGIGRAGNS